MIKYSPREQDAYHAGYLEGLRKVRLEAENRAILEDKIQMATKLLDLLDDATIAKAIRLPLEKVQELRKQALDLVN